MEKNITIQDIADRANVSISTVSRVLNETAPVAKDTRARVLSIIEELGYQPNLSASRLAGGRSRTIGVLTQLIGSPFYDVILRGIFRGIDSSGYSPLFADGRWDAEKDLVALNMFMQHQVDGLIILNGHTPDDVLIEIAQEIPVVIIGRKIPEIKDQCMPFDDFEAAKNATHYLINAGHRRIAHITGLMNHEDAIERQKGYIAAFKEAGLELSPELIIEGDFTEPSGMMAVEMLMLQGHLFSAIFAANDQMAFGARLALYRRGLRVPEDVSLIGFDDQVPSAYMIPPLTTMRRPPLEIGETAGKALVDMIQGKQVVLPKFLSKLIIRESVSRRL